MSFGPVKIKERKRRYTHVVDVEVDVSLADLPSEDLIQELKDRDEWVDESAEHAALLEDIASRLRCGDVSEAIIMIERELMPKWRDEKRALESYVKVMGRVPAVMA